MNAREFKKHLVELLRREHHAMADFILALATFDREKRWRELEYASLFSFLRSGLGLSAGAAQYRKTAAELVQRYPQVEDALRQGKLCLSSVVELAKVLTPGNVSDVLPRFFGLSRREAAEVAVSIRPVESPPLREVVTVSQSVTPRSTARSDQRPDAPTEDAGAPPLRPAEAGRRTNDLLPFETAVSAVAPHPGPMERPSTIEPLDGTRARLHITVSRRLLAKLEAAKAALSHSHPGASSEEVLEAALDLLLTQRAKRKGLVEKPRKTASAPVRSETIPAAVKREVWTRAGGRCEWRLDSGGVCGSTLRLELDHITPRALGGPSTADNLRVSCRVHNLLAARQAFGDQWMDRFTRPARSAATNAARPPGSSVAPNHSRGTMPATGRDVTNAEACSLSAHRGERVG
jgi:5-methylcytosine-specific restriction endonuclease McrA